MIQENHVIDVCGEHLCAKLYRPDNSYSQKRPCIVLGHGFSLICEAGLEAYAQRFCQNGYIALAFDYRYFGQSSGKPRGLISIKHQLEDWHSALAYAHRLPGVDGDNMVTWGSSFAGGHVITVAAHSKIPVAAAISQIPFVDGFDALRRTGLVQAFRLGISAFYDIISVLFRLRRKTIAVAGEPGSIAAITTPDALYGYRKLTKGTRWRNEITASVMLSVPFYRPVRYAKKVKCPLLLCIAMHDDVVSPHAALDAAAKMPNSHVQTYSASHFDLYHGDTFDKAIRHQVEFLKKTLGEMVTKQPCVSNTLC